MKTTAIAIIAAIVTISCASTGSGGGAPLTTEQKIISCVAIVAAGALIAKALGNKPGKGAAIGGATCAVWLVFDNERDKRRIAEAKLKAMESGQAQQTKWRGDDGRMRTVNVSLGAQTPLLTAKQTGVYCRTLNTQVRADGTGEDALDEVWCRTPDGQFIRKHELTA